MFFVISEILLVYQEDIIEKKTLALRGNFIWIFNEIVAPPNGGLSHDKRGHFCSNATKLFGVPPHFFIAIA
jgi:hypothetical protein